jgi:glycosyltransferase involved in cell wall biosynthesis
VLVSVVVPTRGRAGMLAQALASIESQDLVDVVETVVVFDHDAPDTSLEQGGRRPVRVLPNARAQGPAGSRNTGVLAARGTWVAFLDDDDVWHRDKLRRQLEQLRASGRSCCVTTIATVQGGRRVVRRVDSDELTHAMLLRNRTQSAHQSTVVVSRAALRGEVGMFDERVPSSYMEDYDWLLRASRVEPIAVVTAPLVEVRWHEASWFYDRWAVILEAIDYMLTKHPDLLHDPTGAATLLGRAAYSSAALGRRRSALLQLLQVVRRNPLEPRWLLTLPVVVDPRLAVPLVRLVRRVTGRSV